MLDQLHTWVFRTLYRNQIKTKQLVLNCRLVLEERGKPEYIINGYSQVDIQQYFLQGTFLMTQAVAKIMVDQGVANGAIVNLASIVGKVSDIVSMLASVLPKKFRGVTEAAEIMLQL